jgi:hypothetical protein
MSGLVSAKIEQLERRRCADVLSSSRHNSVRYGIHSRLRQRAIFVCCGRIADYRRLFSVDKKDTTGPTIAGAARSASVRLTPGLRKFQKGTLQIPSEKTRFRAAPFQIRWRRTALTDNTNGFWLQAKSTTLRQFREVYIPAAQLPIHPGAAIWKDSMKWSSSLA